MIGQHVGKYRVVDRIGRGGMGTVYRATDETLRRDVAIKVLNSDLNDPEVGKRFHAEAVTVARLSHPGIARIYELFEHQGQWLMVMELVSGETLERLVERAGVLPPVQAAEVCMQALAALGHAHGMGVVHRDLKPANIMVTDTGAIVIMDFGIARVAGAEHLTSAGFMMGTPAYMAPEQVLGHDIDARADLYALGVVFFRLVTAALPFKGETPIAQAHAQVSTPPTPAATIRRDLPAWVDELLTRALAKSPDERFQSALEFHDALLRAIGGTVGASARVMPAAAPYTATPPRPMPAASTDVTMLATPTPRLGTVATAAPAGTGRSSLSLFDDEPAAAAGSVTASQSRVPLWGLGAAAAVFVLVAATLVVRSWSATQEPPSPTTTETGPAAPTPAALVMPAAAEPSSPPPSATGMATASAPVVPGAVKSAGAVTGGGGEAVNTLGAAPIARGVTPGAADAAARGSAGSTKRPGLVTNDPLLAIADARLIVVEGRKGKDEEVLLQFAGGQLSIVGRRSGTAMMTVPYASILGATYARARDPKSNPGFFAPPKDLDIGGVLRTSKHWLTLQGADSFVILRLEDSNIVRVLEVVESRLGLKVFRPVTDEAK